MSTERNRRKRRNLKANRHKRLAAADKTGWKQCSEYHYQKRIGLLLVDWWPTTSKIMVKNEVYKILDESDIEAIALSLAKEPNHDA